MPPTRGRGPTTIELLRHAAAGSRKNWNGTSDALRPLTDKGWRQARALAAALSADSGDAADRLAALYSSPLTRCLQTFEPLVAACGLEVVPDGRIGEAVGVPVAENGSTWVASAWLGGRALGLVDELVGRYEGRRVALCSHGDVIPALLAVLAGRDGLALPDVRLAKGARVTLTFEGTRCVGAAMVAKPVVSAD